MTIQGLDNPTQQYRVGRFVWTVSGTEVILTKNAGREIVEVERKDLKSVSLALDYALKESIAALEK